jgi:hypothetical protein
MKSGEPERVAAMRRLAHAHSLWRDLHAVSKKACTDEHALELFDVVAELYGSETATADGLAAAFEENSASSQFLAELPAGQIAAFILNRRRENSGEAQDPTEAAPPQAGAAPCIVVPARVSRRDLEPLRYWLFGTQDWGTRALAAVVALVAVGVLGVSLVEIPNRWVRDAAVVEIGDALQRGDHEAAIEAAEHFLGASRPQIADPRREAMLDVYAREFSNWFNNLAEPVSETDHAHIERYRKLAIANQPNRVKP